MSEQTGKAPYHIRFLLLFAKVETSFFLLLLSVLLAFIGFCIGRRDVMFFGAVLTVSAVGFMFLTFILTADALMVTIGQATQEAFAKETGRKARESAVQGADAPNPDWKLASLRRH